MILFKVLSLGLSMMVTCSKLETLPSWLPRNGAGRLVAVILGGAGVVVHESERPFKDSVVG